jgi:O-antigen/teichoic acid export membrane protein
VSGFLAKNTAFLTVASVAQKIIAFVYFLFLARIMLPEMTGQYFLAASIAVIFTVVADMGITPVVIREIAIQKARAKEILGQAISIKIPLIIMAMGGAILTARFLGYDPTLQKLIALASLVLALDSIHLLFYGALRGFQQLKYESVGVFTGQLTIGILGGAVLWLHPSLFLLILALMSGSVVNVLIAGCKVVKIIGWESLTPRWRKTETMIIAKRAIPFALASIFAKVYSYVDSILISKFLDSAAVGIYSIAYKFTYAFQFLPLSFVAALYPGMSSVFGKDDNELARIFLRSMWYMGILSTPIVLGIWVVAPDAVLLAGAEYKVSAPVLSTLVFVLFPIFLDFPIGSLFSAAGMQTLKTIIVGVTMVLNTILNWFLIPEFGLLGAAYSALVSFGFMFAIGLVFVKKAIPSFRYLTLVRTLFPIFVSGFVMLFTILIIRAYVNWTFLVPIGAIIYVFTLFATGVVRKEDVTAFSKSFLYKV